MNLNEQRSTTRGGKNREGTTPCQDLGAVRSQCAPTINGSRPLRLIQVLLRISQFRATVLVWVFPCYWMF